MCFLDLWSVLKVVVRVRFQISFIDFVAAALQSCLKNKLNYEKNANLPSRIYKKIHNKLFCFHVAYN